jgi:DNA-binding transcriptional MerR regulator
MKGWNTIGEFSKKTELSAKALRLYENMGILVPHTRGENHYRYYHDDQTELAKRLKEFKNLGFSLTEIKSLLEADQRIDSTKMALAMKKRLSLISAQFDQLTLQKDQIQSILASLDQKTEPLKAQQRRAIMSFYGKVSIVVTGRDGLEKTANFIQDHFKNAKQEIPVLKWTQGFAVPEAKPYILIVEEADLASNEILKLHPDVIVIKSLGEHSEKNQQNYLNLYSGIGPHVNTIVNADDRSAVELAGQAPLKKGRIFYFSKNKGLKEQIGKIGGVVSDGEDVEVFGFNLKPDVLNFKLPRIMTFEDEIALLSSIGAVMTVGFEEQQLQLS